MKELSMLAKSLWMTVISWSALIGIALSHLLIGGILSFIIGFKIMAIWVLNVVIIIYLGIRDAYRINHKRSEK